ncbi:hypothetical protein AM593_01997, partial [Mytilus galloprovincialis]
MVLVAGKETVRAQNLPSMEKIVLDQLMGNGAPGRLLRALYHVEMVLVAGKETVRAQNLPSMEKIVLDQNHAKNQTKNQNGRKQMKESGEEIAEDNGIKEKINFEHASVGHCQKTLVWV